MFLDRLKNGDKRVFDDCNRAPIYRLVIHQSYTAAACIRGRQW